jgi:hypothetical protein
MRKLSFLLSALVFLVNPGLGCGGGPSSFQFGEAEMRAAVDGRWRISWSVAGGASSTVTVQISGATEDWDSGVDSAMRSAMRSAGRHSFVRSAAACESRSFFVKSAAACMDDTRMSLRVVYVSGDSIYQPGPSEAILWVSGFEFQTGDLQLVFGPAQDPTLASSTLANINIRSNGTVVGTQGSLPGVDVHQVTVTAEHVSP